MLLLCVGDRARDGVARLVHPSPRLVADGSEAAEGSGEGAAEVVQWGSHFRVFWRGERKKREGESVRRSSLFHFHLPGLDVEEEREELAHQLFSLSRPLSLFLSPTESLASLSRARTQIKVTTNKKDLMSAHAKLAAQLAAQRERIAELEKIIDDASAAAEGRSAAAAAVARLWDQLDADVAWTASRARGLARKEGQKGSEKEEMEEEDGSRPTTLPPTLSGKLAAER